MRVVRALLLALAGSLAAPAASADLTLNAPVLVPIPEPLTLHPLLGEPTGTEGITPAMAVLPMRLSLLGEAFPFASAGADDPLGCSADAAGNAQYGFPIEHQIYLAMTEHLAVHGFSRGGCPVDAVAGGAVTYDIPMTSTVSIVPSAGAYTQSTLAGQPRTHGQVRVDLMMDLGSGRSLGIGVGGAGHGRRGIAVTGTW